MASYYFGKDIKITYFYRADSIPSSDTPSISIFADLPNRTDAAAGTGAIETLTSWSDSDKDNAKEATFTAIADPTPTSNDDTEDYYLAFNYTLETSGDTVTDIQQVHLRRSLGQTENLEVYASDIEGIYPAIGNYTTPAELESFIELATEIVISDFNKINIDWNKIKDRNKLYLAIAYKTISEIMLEQFKDVGDSKHEKYLIYQSKYEKELSGLEVSYDSDSDGVGDVKIGTLLGFSYSIK